MDPATLALLLKGGSQAIQSGSRLMRPKFGSSAYGRQLKQVKRDGALSKGQETGIIGNVSRTASRQSAVANKRYMGGLINRGMQGSVSAQRGLREAEADVRRTVADTGREMFQNEERAKSDAKMQYARGLDQDKAERTQAGYGLASTALGVAGGLYDAKSQREGDTRESYLDMATKYGADNIQKINAPGDDQERYTRYGAKADAMPIERKQAIEEYAQKSNIKNASSVANTFEAFQNGDVDADNFVKEMSKLGISKEQIAELVAIMMKGK